MRKCYLQFFPLGIYNYLVLTHILGKSMQFECKKKSLKLGIKYTLYTTEKLKWCTAMMHDLFRSVQQSVIPDCLKKKKIFYMQCIIKYGAYFESYDYYRQEYIPKSLTV